ncbi:MAG TPA: hypothetical protein VFJ48_00830 [Casimicrobiaceae bacterium]|nr:hypothetical protein [Casimicrobiaceae bacterium]
MRSFVSLRLARDAFALAFVPALAAAQPLPLQDQLPAWAAKPWAVASAANNVEISGVVNPFYQRGDFDGDGKADLAILVRDKASGKIGILMLHRAGKPALLGAGRPFANGGDDFAWIDQWSVDDGGSNPRRSNRAPAGPADALWVAKEGAASALIRYRNHRYVWQQQGD